ncbi:MAG: type II toxin-antitoxin system PemK/MazF family toxin [Pyrinomonadaceae bacterium]
MAGILRGDIVWAELDPTVGSEQSGRRPVLVISNNIFNQRSGTVIAFTVTSQEPRAPFPLTAVLSNKNLSKESWVKIGQIRTLSIQRLGRKIGEASSTDLDLIVEGFTEIIDG